MSDGGTILDDCCVLNLYATGRMAQVLETLPGRFAIDRWSVDELQWLSADDMASRELVDIEPLIDLDPLIDQGLLDPLAIEEDGETNLFTTFAKEMEDREAQAAALAVSRGYVLATDERKVRRILAAAHPSVTFISTAELLYQWQSRLELASAEVTEVLCRVARRALFTPPRGDPRRDWWIAQVGSRAAH